MPIQSITALVGENASGKSSILECVHRRADQFNYRNEEGRYFLLVFLDTDHQAIVVRTRDIWLLDAEDKKRDMRNGKGYEEYVFPLHEAAGTPSIQSRGLTTLTSIYQNHREETLYAYEAMGLSAIPINMEHKHFSLMFTWKLHEHLVEVDERVEQLFKRLTDEMAEHDGVTEQLKARDQMAWVDKIKAMLVDMGIPKEEIAVKTSKVDELGKTNLMSRDCPIRYIITVNALKEGWDCPFAYILASLANKTSKVDVEQILGRILRQPYAKRHSSPLLNTSYVLTCSNDFRNTLDSIVSGLNMAGFSRKDFRVGEAPTPAPAPKPNEAEQMELGGNPPAAETDSFDDINAEEVRRALESKGFAVLADFELRLKQDNGTDIGSARLFLRDRLLLDTAPKLDGVLNNALAGGAVVDHHR